MGVLEIVLLVCGCILIAASFMISPGKKAEEKEAKELEEISEEQKARLKEEIEKIIDNQLESVGDRTEAEMDRLSAQKILELGEYSDTVLDEINRNHKETMFLYDMLNEKSKELKITVKDVNVAKKQVEKMQEEAANSQLNAPASGDDNNNSDTAVQTDNAEKPKTRRTRKKASTDNTSSDTSSNATTSGKTTKSKDASNEEAQDKTVEKTTKSTGRRNSKAKKEPAKTVDTGLSKTQNILALSKEGMDSRQIAKQLGLGIGEVELILKLYKA